ncbi:hypothetical protein OROGR_006105 [Orobanche gracilis]
MDVYGSEVTEATVKRQPGYVKDTPVTKYDKAKLAIQMINDESKRDRAIAYLKDLEEKYSGVNGVATKGLIYNGTGETLTYIKKHDYAGHYGDSMPPSEIRNGQWGVFFHQKASYVPGASEGALVYGLDGADCMMSWWTRWAGQNHCYAEIRGKGHFDDTVWGVVEDKMWKVEENKWTETANPHQISTAIGDTSICEYSAVVKLLY